MAQQDWLTETDKSTYIGNKALAEWKAKMATTQAQLQRQMDEIAGDAKLKDAYRKGKKKADKEALAAKQKAKGSGESLTESLPEQQVDTKNPQAGMQGGGSDLSSILPPAGEAPPFLMDTQRQVTVGPEQINPVVRAPVRRETNRTNVSPNAMTAAQAQQGQLARAKAMVEQKRWEQEQSQRERDLVTNTYLELSKEGITGDLAGISTALQRGDVATAERLMGDNKMLSARLADARIKAANTQSKADLARIGKLNAETDLAKSQLAQSEGQRSLLSISGLPDYSGSVLPGDSGSVGGMKVKDIITKLDNNVLDKDGSVLPGRDLSASAIQTELFKRGVVVAFEAPGEGVLGSKYFQGKRTYSAPLSSVLSDLEAYAFSDDAEAKKRLLNSGLFAIEGNDMVPIAETKPKDRNAEMSAAVFRVFSHRLTVKEKTGQTLPVPEPLIEETTEPAATKPNKRNMNDIMGELNTLKDYLRHAPEGRRTEIVRKIQKLKEERREYEDNKIKDMLRAIPEAIQRGVDRERSTVNEEAERILGRQ